MKRVIAFSMLAAFIFAGCTVKQIVKDPSGPSYEQQQKSSDKAFQGM